MLVRPAFLKLKRREKSKLCFSFPFNSLELNNLYVTNIPWPDTVSGDCQIASIVAASVVIVSLLLLFSGRCQSAPAFLSYLPAQVATAEVAASLTQSNFPSRDTKQPDPCLFVYNPSSSRHSQSSSPHCSHAFRHFTFQPTGKSTSFI